MGKVIFLCTIAGLLAGCAESPPPIHSGDRFVFLASDSFFGPSTADAEVAARSYCATRGKTAQLVARERPHEMENDIFPEYAMMTYRCVSLAAAKAEARPTD